MEQDKSTGADKAQYDAADANISASEQYQRDGDTRRPKRRSWRSAFLLLIIGIILGVAGTVLGPRYAPEYLEPLESRFGVSLGVDELIEGSVDEKRLEDDRLMLRVSSSEGVGLAIFTTNLEDIDLLINKGDQIELEADAYAPFMNDPAIRRVRPAAGPSNDESADAEPSETAVAAAPVGQPERPQPAQPAAAPSATPDLVTGVEISADQRQADVEQMEERLAQLNAGLDALEQRVTGGDAPTDFDVRQQFSGLHQQSAIARQQLDALTAARPNEWQRLREDFEEEWEEFRRALAAAEATFSESAETPQSSPR